jgi:diketogulonate reductase-like aldo/keto reductase
VNQQSIRTLNNGVEMPVMGFGTNVLRGTTGVEAIKTALATGYRLVDTAQSYGNENLIGQAVAESGVPREEVFITTKIADEHQGIPSTFKSVETSLSKLRTDYVDLLLIHWPYPDNFTKSLETWRAMIALLEEGKACAIGVSNFTNEMVERIIDNSEVIPAVIQVEIHPFLDQKALIEFCRAKGLLVESYCPIARAQRLDVPVLQRLAKKYDKSPVQIILRWQLDHELVPIPRSTNPDHIRENVDIFDFSLTPEEVEEIDHLHDGYRIVHPKNAPASW